GATSARRRDTEVRSPPPCRQQWQLPGPPTAAVQQFSWEADRAGPARVFVPAGMAIPSPRPSRAGERRPILRAPVRRAWSTTLPGWQCHLVAPSNRSVVVGTAEQVHYIFIRTPIER